MMPTSGTLTHFYVRLNENAANKDKGRYVFTVRKNGKDTDVTVTIVSEEGSQQRPIRSRAPGRKYSEGDTISHRVDSDR